MERFISYAQNLEDVLLRRVLRSVERGFYIDVGASDPVFDSVTKAFYEAGWSGINVEPVVEPFQALETDRPRDINLNIALGSTSGSQELFLIDGGNGLSTSVETYAEKHGSEGHQVTRTVVPRETLVDVCAKHVAGEIHFLKVDVEGQEREVLEGADFSRWRPWIVLVEATEPNSSLPTHEEWEGLLIGARYSFVFFDGLNRFYVANERLDDLAPSFNAPANVLDGYDRYLQKWHIAETARLQAEASRRDSELDACHQELFEASRWFGVLSRDVHNARLALEETQAAAKHLERRAAKRESELKVLKRRHAQMCASTSWRVTRPLRLFSKVIARARKVLR